MTTAKAERMDMRLSGQQKRLIEQGAALTGLSVSDFVIQSAARAAEQLVQSKQVITLTLEGQQALVAALESPPAPNAALRRAFGQYKARQGNE